MKRRSAGILTLMKENEAERWSTRNQRVAQLGFSPMILRAVSFFRSLWTISWALPRFKRALQTGMRFQVVKRSMPEVKTHWQTNPSSAIIIKRKKGLSVSNQQLKVNIFCWALFDPFTFEDSMKEGAQLMFSKNYEDKAWPCNQIKSCVSWPSGCKTFQTHENKEKSFRSVWKEVALPADRHLRNGNEKKVSWDSND